MNVIASVVTMGMMFPASVVAGDWAVKVDGVEVARYAPEMLPEQISLTLEGAGEHTVAVTREDADGAALHTATASMTIAADRVEIVVPMAINLRGA